MKCSEGDCKATTALKQIKIDYSGGKLNVVVCSEHLETALRRGMADSTRPFVGFEVSDIAES